MNRLPFQKLQIWQKGMQIAREIYRITKSFPKEELYGLTSQLRRAAVSIPSNIAEGNQKLSDKEFFYFILIAKGSLAEVQTQLILAQDFQYVASADFAALYTLTDELQKMIYVFCEKSRNS